MQFYYIYLLNFMLMGKFTASQRAILNRLFRYIQRICFWHSLNRDFAQSRSLIIFYPAIAFITNRLQASIKNAPLRL